ncbi:hypothetical protein STVA_02010 [Allostella vacuolata]|nr:hypothetical protein STVA_02010 [Stella vacuolata]
MACPGVLRRGATIFRSARLRQPASHAPEIPAGPQECRPAAARSPCVRYPPALLLLALVTAAPSALASDPGPGERSIVGRLELHPDGRVVRMPVHAPAPGPGPAPHGTPPPLPVTAIGTPPAEIAGQRFPPPGR